MLCAACPSTMVSRPNTAMKRDDLEGATARSTTRMWVARRHPPAPTPAAQLDVNKNPGRGRSIRTDPLPQTCRKAPVGRRHVPGPPRRRASLRRPVPPGRRVRRRLPSPGPRSTARREPGSLRVGARWRPQPAWTIWPGVEQRNPVTPSVTTSGTAPSGHAMTGVPQAIASIMTRPKGSGQSMGNSSARARPSRSAFTSWGGWSRTITSSPRSGATNSSK